ncbi:hypothetical protein [Sinorhizobium prairiense]|nr:MULTISPECIES: hypothetical protein [unclassified Sinorhizobium]WEJ08558.1 hypothetical protein N0Q90_02565 [Sinorhizobium sp. M103]WEJ13938.1 hypothetical protein N0Q91_00155 [Sinorhizobium sp. K101]WEJ35540.1 hypothetical protein N0R80_00150 [Sinorhizobium sp. C101]
MLPRPAALQHNEAVHLQALEPVKIFDTDDDGARVNRNDGPECFGIVEL